MIQLLNTQNIVLIKRIPRYVLKNLKQTMYHCNYLTDITINKTHGLNLNLFKPEYDIVINTTISW